MYDMIDIVNTTITQQIYRLYIQIFETIIK